VKRAVGILLLLLIAGGGIFLFLPRAGALTADVAATLAILNTEISARRGTPNFVPALDGELLASGDVVKSSADGRAVLTFFDGSTLTVETGSSVTVTTLNRLPNGGIQVVIEQAIGRTWASVSRLKTPDSKFELRTPTSAAVVRGTGFETTVTQLPDNTTTATYVTDDGEILVTAAAGGQTVVGANTQVTIAQGQTAPAAATPTPAGPILRITASAGLGFAAAAPTGAACDSAGNKAEIPGCLVNGNVVTIRRPVAGRYSLMLTAAAAAPNATLRVDALRGTGVEATQTLTRTFAAADLVRTAFTYGAATPQSVGAFEPAEQVASVCAALAAGRVFASGAADARYDGLKAFAASNRSQAASFVVTEAELAQSVTRAVADSGGGIVTVRDVKIAIDGSGIHFAGSIVTPLGSFASTGDVIAGPVNGTLVMRARNLTAGPLPAAILDLVANGIEQGAARFTSAFPLSVRQVTLRPGCFGVIGSTPR
jgi:hypothetical protein